MFVLTLLLVVSAHAPRIAITPPPIDARSVASYSIPSVASYSLDEIVDAVRITETGGHKDGGRHATGDGGRAIGPFQIHRIHWLDTGVAGQYEECRDPKYARQVVLAYWKRWCPDALERCDAQALARTHNGGPTGSTKASTVMYWNKVQDALVRARAARATERIAVAAAK